jgi:hypothetical protein
MRCFAKRHKPDGAPKAFVVDGSVAIYATAPPEEATRDDYVPLKN